MRAASRSKATGSEIATYPPSPANLCDCASFTATPTCMRFNFGERNSGYLISIYGGSGNMCWAGDF